IREPEVAVRSGRDGGMLQVGRSYREFGDDAARRNASDLLGVGLDEPEIAIGTGGDGSRLCVGRGDGELGEHSVRREAPDPATELSEPEIAVRPGRDPAWIIPGLRYP